MIEIKNITFHYSKQEEQDVPPALQDVNLHIHAGETLAIIGHNGSGKSTLSKLIAAILQPTSGTILIDGLHVASSRDAIWKIRQRVGIVFQNPDDQLIASTVIDDISFGPENLGLPREEIEQRVQDALALLDLTTFAQMPISELSVSLKQRVAIAGVLAMRPRYLILDEPTTMISGHTARHLLETVQRLAREQGIAVIHITHFMQEITTFDRVIVMDQGRIIMDGTPSTIFAQADALQAIRLDVPVVTRLGAYLRTKGWSHLPDVVLFPEQLLAHSANNHQQESDISPANKEHQEHTQNTNILNDTPLANGEHQEITQNTNTVSDVPSPQTLVPTKDEQTKSVFELKEIFFSYQRSTPLAREALRGLTLNIPERQTIAIVGPTGSGKSTLLDLLAGLIKPEKGKFFFAGQDATAPSFKLERIRSQVGVVFQSPEAQIFEETVGKDVSFGPRQKKVPLAESRRLVQESLEAMGLPYEDFRSRYTYALSGGQKRRVAIAGVLAQQSKIILFDEPMAGLDPRGRQELLELITNLKQRNHLTIVYASTSLKDVIELADIVHILDQGHLVASGTPREILSHAATLHNLDIALPETAQIALTLRKALPTLRTDILDLPELEEELLEC